MMQDGFTFLELTVVLLIIAILALFAAPQYHAFLERHDTQTEINQIVRTINLARQQAILRRETIMMIPNDSWSLGISLQDESQKIFSILTFQQQAEILLKTFPANSDNALHFSSNGLTKTQNGSFYYCPKNIELAKRIVFNQAGRVYVTTDEAMTTCSSVLVE